MTRSSAGTRGASRGRVGKLIVLVAVLTSSVASAQPDSVEASTPAPRKKRPGVATALALGTFSSGIVAAGLRPDSAAVLAVSAGLVILGPSVGHVYAGEHRHAVAGSLLRAGGLGLIVLGTWAGVPHEHNGFLAFAGIAGAGVLTGAIAYDLIDAPQAARRANVVLTPAMVREAPGLALAGTF